MEHPERGLSDFESRIPSATLSPQLFSLYFCLLVYAVIFFVNFVGTIALAFHRFGVVTLPAPYLLDDSFRILPDSCSIPLCPTSDTRPRLFVLKCRDQLLLRFREFVYRAGKRLASEIPAEVEILLLFFIGGFVQTD
jgi:hypothetical protein